MATLAAASFVAACASNSTSAPTTTPSTPGPQATAPATDPTAATSSIVPATTETAPAPDSIPDTVTDTDSPPTSPPAPDGADLDTAVCWEPAPAGGGDDISLWFDDATASMGLIEPLTGMHGHVAAAGDPNDDGWTDLFVGGFADREPSVYAVRGANGPSPDRLLLGGPDGFRIDTSFPSDLARSSGAVFADLDGDGDDDLVVARNQRGRDGIAGRPTVVLENTGDSWEERTTLADGVAARSVAAVDLDQDGILDLVIAGDRWGDGATEVYRGRGAFAFDDVTADWGIPDDYTGLALATVDIDDDGWIDIVMNGDPRVLLGSATGFTIGEVPELTWETFGDEDDPAGIAVGDLDGDDRPDLVLGHHFNSTLDRGERVPVRLLLNRSSRGAPAFEDVTAQSGSPALWTKSPHVALVDVDNDGLNDVVTSAESASGAPLVLRQIAGDESIGTGPQFASVGEEGSGRYWVTGVTDDLDRDGSIDVFLVEWEPTDASVLARNTSASGAWLELDTTAIAGVIGRSVSVEDPADGRVLARAWPSSTTGYAAGSSGVLHFGLGDAPSEVIVRIGSADGQVAASLDVNARYRPGGCGS